MSIQASITLGTIDENFCAGTWQALAQEIVDVMTITFPVTLSTFNYGNSAPSADDQDKPWIRTTAAGYPDDTYVYKGGEWLALANLPAPGTIVMWQGAANLIDALDGGEATVPGGGAETTGPFWEIVTALSGKFPLGVSTDYAIGTTGGAKETTLTTDQIPSHTHAAPGTGQSFEVYPYIAGDTQSNVSFAEEGQTKHGLVNATKATGGGLAHSNMPPYATVFFIKRTARIYKRV